MPARPVRVSDLSGAAAAAVKSARNGEVVDVTARGETVARIVPAGPAESSFGGMRMVGEGTAFRLPRRVGRMEHGAGTISAQLVADRER